MKHQVYININIQCVNHISLSHSIELYSIQILLIYSSSLLSALPYILSFVWCYYLSVDFNDCHLRLLFNSMCSPSCASSWLLIASSSPGPPSSLYISSAVSLFPLGPGCQHFRHFSSFLLPRLSSTFVMHVLFLV